MSTPDKIDSVQAKVPEVLSITLCSGKVYAVSLAAPMRDIAGFAPIKDATEFATAKVVDHGWTVEWDCGLSMASERLYQMAKEQAGEAFPLAEFRAWMQRNDLSLTTAADTLGLSRRAISQYSAGSRHVPKVVGLACQGWELMRKSSHA